MNSIIEMLSRNLILLTFCASFITSLVVMRQAHKLSLCLPSKSWTVKKYTMVFFMHAQVFGILKTYFSSHEFAVTDFIYHLCVLVMLVGLMVHNRLLLADYRRLRARGPHERTRRDD